MVSVVRNNKSEYGAKLKKTRHNPLVKDYIIDNDIRESRKATKSFRDARKRAIESKRYTERQTHLDDNRVLDGYDGYDGCYDE